MEEKEPQTEEEKFKFQLQAEAELAQLQRQYGIAARGRAEFSEEISPQYQKQKHVLTILKKERDELHSDLMVANNPAKKKADKKVLKQLQALLDEYASFGEKIAAKRAHLMEVNDQIKMVKKNIVDLKSKMVTHSQCDERLWIGMKHLETLENKLEVQVKKFCSIRAQNSVMRDQIDHLLMERQNFMKIWNRLLVQLNIGKKFMLDLIEQATLAYDQREEWCSKLQALRTKAHSDLIHQTQEMREFVCKKDNNEKFQDFIQAKGQKRVMRDLQIKEMEKRENRRNKMDELLTNYQNFMNDIWEFTEETEVERITSKYMQQEADNFALFKYVNDLNREMEDINDQLILLHVDVDDEKVLYDQRRLHQDSKLSNLQTKLDETTAEREAMEQILARVSADLDAMMSGVDNLFKLCRCDNDSLMELLGNYQTINYYNIQLYQSLLEQKVQEFVLYSYHRDKIKRFKAGERLIKEDAHGKIYKLEQIVGTNPCPLCVEHEQVSDVIDVVQKVWTREEAKEKLAQRLQLPDGKLRLHNVSACHLPKSRQIMQKRYQ